MMHGQKNIKLYLYRPGYLFLRDFEIGMCAFLFSMRVTCPSYLTICINVAR